MMRIKQYNNQCQRKLMQRQHMLHQQHQQQLYQPAKQQLPAQLQTHQTQQLQQMNDIDQQNHLQSLTKVGTPLQYANSPNRISPLRTVTSSPLHSVNQPLNINAFRQKASIRSISGCRKPNPLDLVKPHSPAFIFLYISSSLYV
ncbi:hypothetical protein RYX36_021788 [Vicia faba]